MFIVHAESWVKRPCVSMDINPHVLLKLAGPDKESQLTRAQSPHCALHGTHLTHMDCQSSYRVSTQFSQFRDWLGFPNYASKWV